MGVCVTATEIHKTYHRRRHAVTVLQGASLRVDVGEAVAVVGISGAGKSTLLHVLGGLDRPDSGRVEIGGEDLFGASAGRRAAIRAQGVGFVFQSYQLLPEMDVVENVMLPGMALRRRGQTLAGLRARAQELLAAVGLADRASHTPLELSGGEQQRVALARALMNDPPLLLADEPTGNLDAGTGGVVLQYMFALTRQRGHTLIVVTHSEQIARACDRVLRLEHGQLVPVERAAVVVK